MNTIFASPPTGEAHLERAGSQSGEEESGEENMIRVKLFFYSDSKALRKRVFNEEWYVVAQEDHDADEIDQNVFQPWLEVSQRDSELIFDFSMLLQFYVHDFATFGEMLLMGLTEANQRLEVTNSESRFL